MAMRVLIDLATGVVGLLAQVLGLAIAIVAGARVARKRWGRKRAEPRRSWPLLVSWSGAAMLLGLAMGVAVGAVRCAPGALGQPAARQISLAEAFRALDAAKWSEALRRADEVIAIGGVARLEQERLELAGTRTPPAGKIPPEQREAVFARGVLNDVAAALFVRGRALEGLGEPDAAARTYRDLSALTHARVYDPSQDVFWAPAEFASGRLRSTGQ